MGFAPKTSTMRQKTIQVTIMVILRIFSWKCCTSSWCKRRFPGLWRVLRLTVPLPGGRAG